MFDLHVIAVLRDHSPLPSRGGRADPGAAPGEEEHNARPSAPPAPAAGCCGVCAATLELACHRMEVLAEVVAGEPQNPPSRDGITAGGVGMAAPGDGAASCFQGGSAQGASLEGACASVSHS